MSTKEKTTKPKRVRAPRPKKSDTGEVLGLVSEEEGHEEPLPTLPKPPAKVVQETFRCTRDEHATLVRQASAEKFVSMGAFYRTKLGLEG